jgi:hypothetical protein
MSHSMDMLRMSDCITKLLRPLSCKLIDHSPNRTKKLIFQNEKYLPLRLSMGSK